MGEHVCGLLRVCFNDIITHQVFALCMIITGNDVFPLSVGCATEVIVQQCRVAITSVMHISTTHTDGAELPT